MKHDIHPYTRQFYRGNIGNLTLAVLASLLSTAGALAVSWLLQQIMDLMAGATTYRLMDLVCVSGLLVIIRAASGALDCFATPRFTAKAMAQYRDFVFEELTKKNLSALSGENSALYISALSNDANAIETGYLDNIIPIIQYLMLMIGALFMMFWYNPLFTVAAMALSLLPVAASLAMGGRVAKAETQVSECNVTYTETVRDSLSGFSVIKSFQAERRILELFLRQTAQLHAAKSKKQRASILVETLSNCAELITQLGVFLFGAYLALSGRGVTAGTVLLFVQVMNYVLQPISVIPNALAQQKAAKALIEKLAAALPKNVREDGHEVLPEMKDGISLEHVSFSYDGNKPALDDFNFHFQAGMRYAIVGGSGSGKSTLLDLLMNAHPDFTGDIRYDGLSLRDISGESLYRSVCVVQQNVFLFNASIRDNITMFSDFPEADVERVIRQSGLSELVESKGADYRCGENGNALSGGEKQRISIARSLLKKSQVLLVDEATAALDPQTAYQVSDAILRLTGLTRIVVTHSLEEALLRRYDCILTLKNGKLAESGTFDELMDRRGRFYALFTLAQEES
jgi:ABC-type multidrug transport system fused ATPase/permease subunit